MNAEERSPDCPRPEALAGAALKDSGDGQRRDSAAVGNLGSADSKPITEPSFARIPDPVNGWDSCHRRKVLDWELIPFDYEAHAAALPPLIMRDMRILPRGGNDPYPAPRFELSIESQPLFAWMQHGAMKAQLKRPGKARYVGAAGASIARRSSDVRSVILHNSLTDENG